MRLPLIHKETIRMAIINSQLIISPVIRQYFIDPTTLLPVVGTIQFFKTDKITPKNVFQQTGNPLDPFEVAANPITLDTAGAIPFVLYLYPFDENDADVEELYYVEVRRIDTSLVFALDNFPENFVSSENGSIEDDLINKCPSFGFDNPILAATYTLANQNPLPVNWAVDITNGARVAQGWVWQLEDVSNSEFYYDVTPIAAGSRPGNPINLLTLFSGNIQTQTQNMFGFRLGVANELEGTIINYQLDLQDNLSVLSTLNVFVFNGNSTTDLSAAVNVGTIPISSTLTLQTIEFTMPDLSGSLVDDNSPTWLLLGLPLTQQFSISMTSTYDYFGDNRTISRLPLSYGVSEGRQLTSLNAEELYVSEDNYLQSDLPLTQRKGRLDFLRKTGEIFLASSFYDPTQNGANLLNDRTLVRGDDIESTLTDRFLDNAHLAQFGGNTFIISNVIGSTFDIETQDTAPSFSVWTSTNGDITITETPIGGGIPLSSVINGGNNRQVDITFDNQFDAQAVSNYDTLSTNNPSFIDRGTGYVTNVMANMVGTFSNGQAFGFNVIVNYSIGSLVTITQTAPGSPSTNATCSVEFAVGGFSAASQIQSGTQFFQAQLAQDEDPANVTVFTNYFAFIASSINGGLLQDPPPYAIGFNVDNQGESIKSSVKSIVVNITTAELIQPDKIAIALNKAINGGSSYKIDVVNVPTNGHLLSTSTSNKTINLVLNDTDTPPTPPLKPDPDISTLFVDYSSINDSPTDVSDKIQTKIKGNTGSIPTFTDLGLSTPPVNLLYYVYI